VALQLPSVADAVVVAVGYDDVELVAQGEQTAAELEFWQMTPQ